MYTISPLSIDVIATMDDHEIDTRYRDIIRAMQRVKSEKSRINLEEELCYLYREREIRNNRSRAHREYLSNFNPNFIEE